MAELPPYPGIPRYVRVFGIVVGGLILLAVMLIITGVGRHGPHHHAWSGDNGVPTADSTVAEARTPSANSRGGHLPPEAGRQ